MNNAKIWLVVKPNTGIPLFLSAVAIGSFAVHVAVLSNTTWVADFLAGKPLGSSAQQAALDTAIPSLANAPVKFEGESVLEGDRAAATIDQPVVLAQRTTRSMPD